MTVVTQHSETQEFSKISAGRITTVTGFTNDQLASKLMAMGILPGSQLTLVRKAPFGGAWYVAIDQQFIALRRQEAAAILVK